MAVSGETCLSVVSGETDRGAKTKNVRAKHSVVYGAPHIPPHHMLALEMTLGATRYRTELLDSTYGVPGPGNKKKHNKKKVGRYVVALSLSLRARTDNEDWLLSNRIWLALTQLTNCLSREEGLLFYYLGPGSSALLLFLSSFFFFLSFALDFNIVHFFSGSPPPPH